MATAINFRQQTEATASAMLRQDKAKPQWAKLLFDDMPKDICELALAAVHAEINARDCKATLQAALDDKVQQRPGQRLIVALGRDVGPNTDSVLTAWVSASTSQTRTISFSDFIK